MTDTLWIGGGTEEPPTHVEYVANIHGEVIGRFRDGWTNDLGAISEDRQGRVYVFRWGCGDFAKAAVVEGPWSEVRI